LKNAVERAAVLLRGDMVNSADLGFIDENRAATEGAIEWPDEDLPSATARLEEMLIRRALARSAGNRAEAARMLGIHRQLLYTKMKRHGLDASEDRTEGVGEADGPTGQAESKT
jgi:DNA-binding NtrC family response regulator